MPAHRSFDLDLVRREPYPMPEPPPWMDEELAPEPDNGKAPEPPPAVRTSWTVGDLLAAEFPEPRWIAPGLLPTGLAILAGRPKLGKSWMALQLAVAVGSGGMFLGQRVEAGHALYIALEDNPRRLKSRLEAIGAPARANLHFETAWPALNERGLDALRAYAEGQHPALVVVDTLTRAFTGRTDWNEVGIVTECLSALQHLALAHDCAVLLVDHHKKPGAADADAIDDVLGSTGKAAVADTLWGLYRKRGEAGAKLRATGRDVEEATLALTFDGLTHCWHVDQDADGVKTGSVQAAIVDALENVGDMTVTALTSYLGKDKGQLSRELGELVAKGVVRKGEGYHAPYRMLTP